MNNNEQGFTHLLLIGAIVGSVVSAAGIVVASNSSKPGDTLYSIDRASEAVQLALAITDGLKTTAHSTIAEERLLEIKSLMEENEIDAEGIDVALSNFTEHKSKLSDLIGDDGEIDSQEQELVDELEDKKSKIDKLFEGQQKSLENRREALKKQYEQALKAGDTARAEELKAQIDGFEILLKNVEDEREAQKQESEERDEAEQQEEESENKSAEEQSEAIKKAYEAQREADKKAAEQD